MKSALKIAVATAAVMLAQPALANHSAKHEAEMKKEEVKAEAKHVDARAKNAEARMERRVDNKDRRIERRTRGRDHADARRGTFWGYPVQSYNTPDEVTQAKRTVKQH